MIGNAGSLAVPRGSMIGNAGSLAVREHGCCKRKAGPCGHACVLGVLVRHQAHIARAWATLLSSTSRKGMPRSLRGALRPFLSKWAFSQHL